MFLSKPKKTFRVSTSRVYLVGRKSRLTRALHFLRPYTARACYRSSGALLAL